MLNKFWTKFASRCLRWFILCDKTPSKQCHKTSLSFKFAKYLVDTFPPRLWLDNTPSTITTSFYDYPRKKDQYTLVDAIIVVKNMHSMYKTHFRIPWSIQKVFYVLENIQKNIFKELSRIPHKQILEYLEVFKKYSMF